MYKVMKMFLVKGLEKINLMKEFTPRNYPTPEERNENSRRIIADLTKGLINETEYMELFEEYQKQESKEARFCLQVAKIESDLQAKIYDLKGQFDVEKAKEDAKYFDNADEIIPQISNASDSWILFDRRYYVDELFKNLSQDIQNLRSL
jgi:5'-deoxynucleotidase YfbR-like HD superfamily hydrolase